MAKGRKVRASRAFFFNDTATTEIYTLSLHDALPISRPGSSVGWWGRPRADPRTARPLPGSPHPRRRDRKSTRLNSSHSQISYAVFCLKKQMREDAARQPYRYVRTELLEPDSSRLPHW